MHSFIEELDEGLLLTVNYDADSNAVRVLGIVYEITEAIARIDQEITSSVNEKVASELILKSLNQGSVKAYLANKLRNIDDEDIRKLDYRAILGKLLVEIKYELLSWLEKENKEGIIQLEAKINQHIDSSEISDLRVSRRINIKAIFNGLRVLEEAKQKLHSGESINVALAKKPPIIIANDVDWSLDEIVEDSLTVKKFPAAEALLIVKRPDYLGNSKWDFKYKDLKISAAIEDLDWLKDFHDRNVIIKPGDGLLCLLETSITYDHHMLEVDRDFRITKVKEVVDASSPRPLGF